ncbi:MAG: hypothetical protein A4E60_03238 [Syntrophorhabdus sp. PtaB.Bin047]|nr:MAG: hypothetical protein A4E60_03238 [Syntrophorhabdus sp. PtaB.Bin047]
MHPLHGARYPGFARGVDVDLHLQIVHEVRVGLADVCGALVDHEHPRDAVRREDLAVISFKAVLLTPGPHSEIEDVPEVLALGVVVPGEEPPRAVVDADVPEDDLLHLAPEARFVLVELFLHVPGGELLIVPKVPQDTDRGVDEVDVVRVLAAQDDRRLGPREVRPGDPHVAHVPVDRRLMGHLVGLDDVIVLEVELEVPGRHVDLARLAPRPLDHRRGLPDLLGVDLLRNALVRARFAVGLVSELLGHSPELGVGPPEQRAVFFLNRSPVGVGRAAEPCYDLTAEFRVDGHASAPGTSR